MLGLAAVTMPSAKGLRVQLLQSAEDLESVLGPLKTAGEWLDCLKHLLPELWVRDDRKSPLDYVVSILMIHKTLHNELDSHGPVSRLK